MFRTILVYGLISGAVVALGIIGTIVISFGRPPHSSVWLGYLVMLVALSSILVGVKQHRDKVLGGVIQFFPAFGIGVGIAFVAGLAYVAVWEGYLAVTHYDFIGDYTNHILATKRAAGVTGAAYAKAVAEMDAMRRAYANPFFQMGEAFIEIFPVGLLVALVSAVLLRNPRFLPAKTAA